ncbi:MAG: hypothetical protein A3J79_00940 [Elusimicrobia bacterium RIFOXYB2_FULL_62_6]|nr:MAG: hypothetical protein A3J79_00940 [Elusimicrobia bacterium RIFOXYB2_FULL_62_6]
MKKQNTLSLALLLCLPAFSRAKTIVIYHTSDVHGWYSARPAEWDNASPERLIGGFAALAALVGKEKNPYLLLDSGDWAQGTPEGILTKGMASVKLMNRLGYAAAVPGNHDYDYGEANLETLVSSSAFSLLAANIYRKGTETQPAYLKPYILLEKGGKKIAVLGLAGRHTATSTLPDNVKMLDFRGEAAEAAKWLPEIKKLNPDAVIVLIHLGFSERFSLNRVDLSTWTFDSAPPGTLELARAVKGVDLVLGGHNHTGLLKGYRDSVSGAWFGESVYGLSYTTRAELDFDDATGRLSGIKVALLPLWTDETGEDPGVLKLIAGFNADVEREMGQVIGRAAADLSFSPDGLDSPIGNWVADLLREEAGTELALQNTRGIRAEIKKGDVRIRDLYQAVPFDNTIVTMRLNGAALMEIMADNLLYGNSLMQISGFEAEFRPGSGGEPAEIRLLRGGRTIKAEDEFTVATNNYLAFGGDGGEAFARGKDIKDTLVPVRDLMAKALAKGPAIPPGTGRIKRLR